MGAPRRRGGSADGQALLGYILTSGPENLRNLDEALSWYQKSAAAGCPQGHSAMRCRWRATATDPDKQAEVTDHLRRAADAGLPTALYLLGMIDERGLGVPADPAAAAELYRQAAEKGHRSGQARWGLALMEGHGGRRQPDRGRIVAAPRRAGRRSGGRGRWSAISMPRAASCRRTMPRRRSGSAAAAEAGHRGAARALGMLHLTGAGVAARPG